MDVAIIVRSLHQFVVDVHGLLVIAVVEGTVGDAHESLDIVPMRVLLVAVQDSQGRQEISLLQESWHVWQLILLLLIVLISIYVPLPV